MPSHLAQVGGADTCCQHRRGTSVCTPQANATTVCNGKRVLRFWPPPDGGDVAYTGVRQPLGRAIWWCSNSDQRVATEQR